MARRKTTRLGTWRRPPEEEATILKITPAPRRRKRQREQDSSGSAWRHAHGTPREAAQVYITHGYDYVDRVKNYLEQRDCRSAMSSLRDATSAVDQLEYLAHADYSADLAKKVQSLEKQFIKICFKNPDRRGIRIPKHLRPKKPRKKTIPKSRRLKGLPRGR